MKRRRNLCFVLAVIALTVFGLKTLTDLMERKEGDFKYSPFFEQKEDFDVLFFGTSHVINGIFPMELWKDYGMVSYNFGGHSNPLATTYWVMKNALDYTSPSLIVIDCCKLALNTKTGVSFAESHMSLDAFPCSFHKIAMTLDLLEDDVMAEMIASGEVGDGDMRTAFSALWNFSVYHSRWNELESLDMDGSVSKEKGAESRIAVAVPNDMPDISKDKKIEGDTSGTKYLCRMIEECKEQGIEVLLTYLPFPANEEEIMEANRIYDIADEYGVNYINFLNRNLVDLNTDCYDSFSHLNPSGARKVTDYLGRYIKKHYKIPDQRENAAYSSWEKDYEKYLEFKNSNIKEQESLDTYLMLLADKNYNIFIEIMDSVIWNSCYYTGLFRNLGIDEKNITDDVDAIMVQSAGQQVDYIKGLRSWNHRQQTSVGMIEGRVLGTGGGYFEVLLNDQQLYCAKTKQEEEDADLRIVVLDKETMKISDLATVYLLCGFDSSCECMMMAELHRDAEGEEEE